MLEMMQIELIRKPYLQQLCRALLTESNRRPPSLPWRLRGVTRVHARSRAAPFGLHVSPNEADDASRDVARVVSDVSVLCPLDGAYGGNAFTELALPGLWRRPSLCELVALARNRHRRIRLAGHRPSRFPAEAALDGDAAWVRGDVDLEAASGHRPEQDSGRGDVHLQRRSRVRARRFDAETTAVPLGARDRDGVGRRRRGGAHRQHRASAGAAAGGCDRRVSGARRRDVEGGTRRSGRYRDGRWHARYRTRARERHREPTCRSGPGDRKSTRLNSSHANISYAVFCLKKKKKKTTNKRIKKKKKKKKK